MHTKNVMPILWQMGKVHVNCYQSTSKWVWQVSLIWSNTRIQTNRLKCLRTPTLTHPHKNVTMSCCVFCSCWLCTVCWVEEYCIIVPPTLCHSPWHGWHDTWRQLQWHLHLEIAADLEGKAKSWTSVTARTQADSLSDSHSVYPTVFSLPLFEIRRSFFFFILTQSVCLAHCQAACLFMCTFELSHNHICVIFICSSAS